MRGLLRPLQAWGRSARRCLSYSALSEADLAFFRQNLPASAIVVDPDALAPFNSDWMAQYHGRSTLALCPESTDQVSLVLGYCNERRLAVVPQGGNTGLVGGSVPVGDEIVLSLGRMSKVRDFDEVGGVLTCDAGCVLEVVDGWLAERGYQMPIDLGSKGSCMVGGVVSTNAGGLRLVRFGSLHGTVLGLEVVLADGSVLSTLKPLRKDNTGYDLKQVFIGAEGTLGVVTGVSILTPARSAARNVALLGVADFRAACGAYTAARRELAGVVVRCSLNSWWVFSL